MLEIFERLALAAGREVMRVFHAGCAVDRKSDSSPVTEADRESEKIILAGLRTEFPDIPCVAEEEAAAGVMPGELGEAFFLVDPLDGTKEFVNRRTDFTVNIALVRHGVPEVGVVFAPCGGRFFSGLPGRAEVLDIDGDYQIIARRPISVRTAASPLAVVASRSHNTPETEAYIRDLGAAEIVSVGSSLKFCLLANGEADVYPRFGRTMEWDTAAGDAVLRAAGGTTRTLDGKPLAYGKRNQADDEDFANPHFIASGSAATGRRIER
ncbi:MULTISPECIES: 3'(2'),5'-bisphosphate nucleotidase CysQ [unclassified Mesorhizobium]|uniref:3'(2'),5'-bisphosphate nucleotidase CysQ n=1 Tax=unclassified Mesorhizobium TaxID=325217 RepID=UPI00142EE5A7|nr:MULTISPECIES: 3'(2'),5'-bisphosphate nucleotidase CysQ [unclassified Mesorhizobium]